MARIKHYLSKGINTIKKASNSVKEKMTTGFGGIFLDSEEDSDYISQKFNLCNRDIEINDILNSVEILDFEKQGRNYGNLDAAKDKYVELIQVAQTQFDDLNEWNDYQSDTRIKTTYDADDLTDLINKAKRSIAIIEDVQEKNREQKREQENRDILKMQMKQDADALKMKEERLHQKMLAQLEEEERALEAEIEAQIRQEFGEDEDSYDEEDEHRANNDEYISTPKRRFKEYNSNYCNTRTDTGNLKRKNQFRTPSFSENERTPITDTFLDVYEKMPDLISELEVLITQIEDLEYDIEYSNSSEIKKWSSYVEQLIKLHKKFLNIAQPLLKAQNQSSLFKGKAVELVVEYLDEVEHSYNILDIDFDDTDTLSEDMYRYFCKLNNSVERVYNRLDEFYNAFCEMYEC